jgi:hypothetical protein
MEQETSHFGGAFFGVWKNKKTGSRHHAHSPVSYFQYNLFENKVKVNIFLKSFLNMCITSKNGSNKGA